MDHIQHDGTVFKVKVLSFLIAIATCSVIHGFVPGWITFFAIVFVLLWATYGYKRLFGGWPDVITLRRSGRAFLLAVCWPLVLGTHP